MDLHQQRHSKRFAHRMVRILLLCLLSVCASAQQGRFIFGSQLNLASTSGSQSPVPFMPNLTEYWEFTSTSLTTNASVTNWIGALQSTVLTNGASALRPTNSASGVGFTGTQVLTNKNLFVGSNWTIAVFYQYTLNNLASAAGSLVGSNNMNADFHNWTIDVTFGGSGKQNWNWSSGPQANGTILGQANNVAIIGNVADLVLVNSNNANGGVGHSYFWTNGVPLVMAQSSCEQGINEFLSFVGTMNAGGNGPGSFGGFIQGVYVQTNFAGDNINASNIHYYRTNFLTKGASP